MWTETSANTYLVGVYESLNENVPYGLRYWNTWSPLGGVVVEALEVKPCWRKYVPGGWALSDSPT